MKFGQTASSLLLSSLLPALSPVAVVVSHHPPSTRTTFVTISIAIQVFAIQVVGAIVWRRTLYNFIYLQQWQPRQQTESTETNITKNRVDNGMLFIHNSNFV